MSFEAKFDKIPQEKQQEIINHARVFSAYAAALRYAAEIGMTEKGLQVRLLRELKRENPDYVSKRQSALKKNGEGKVEKKLSKEEKQFLKDLESGKVGLAEASRLVAKRVFEKMLKNPDDFRFIDFFRTEMLRQKDDENKIKEVWGKEIIARFFAGKLPPPICPQCGFHLMTDSKVIEGEVENELLPDTAGN